MKRIPFLLIYSRLIIALIIIFITIIKISHLDLYITFLLTTGLLTDIFDGIIARKLNVASEKLRIWDSNVDQFFWIAVISSVFYLKYDLIKPHIPAILILILLECLAYLVSYIKFKRTIATHSLLAKFWTLTLLAFLIELLLNSTDTSFIFCFWIGIISRLEILLIILKLKNWTTDIPSIFSVNAINKGLKRKKKLLF